MLTRKASAVWEGNLKQGKGIMKLGSGAFEGAYSFSSRFENGTGTNPEELIGAAHAGCFSMYLANVIDQAGHPPRRVSTSAQVKFTKEETGFRITAIEFDTEVSAPGLDKKELAKHAENAKKNCPVSRSSSEKINITVRTRLVP